MLSLQAMPVDAAQPSGVAAHDLDVEATIAQTVYDCSLTKKAAAQQVDEQIRGQLRAIDHLRAQGMRARTQLAEAQRAFIRDLSAKDRAYAEAIERFRRDVTDLAATPQGKAALVQFNAGQEVEALAILDQLQAARDRAIALAATLERAVGHRRLATLALEARDRGKVSTQSVLARFEAVTRLDPGVFWDWIELSRLYQEASQLPAARAAAGRAAGVATNDWDRMVAKSAEGDVAQAQGDLSIAKARYEEAHQLLTRLLSADPSSASLKRDVSVSLGRVGDVLWRSCEV
jgi:hypothetical protein